MDATQAMACPQAQLVFTVAYNGAGFHGFARQKDPALRTVQGALEDACSTLLARPAELVCAGRTDAGVHALGQVVAFPVDAAELAGRELSRLRISMDALTPDDIALRAAHVADAGFSPRFDAVRRVYRYRIVCGGVPPLFLRGFSWWRRAALDADAMREAAAHLVGEHDFKSFCRAASAEGKNTVRRIESIEIFEEEALGERCLSVEVVGNAFLHSMVRTLVGTLAAVGEGRREPDWAAQVLAACERAAAGETAPAAGLVFHHVEYAPEALRDAL